MLAMEYRHNIPSLEELVRTRKPIKNDREIHEESLSTSERFAVFMHKHVGSIGFFFLIVLWTVGWLGWNLIGPEGSRFDPAPAFVIWIFASNILQLVLLPVIMVGQNIEGRAAEARAKQDFEINKRAEEEIKVVLGHLENQNEMLLEILRKS